MVKRLTCFSTSLRLILLALLGCVAGACGQPKIAPVALNPEDMCSMCRMVISEKRYAAEFVITDGDALKFDDIGCMRDYVKSRGNRDQIAAYFVSDYESTKWIDGGAAHFVESDEFATPMGGGIVAFEDPSKAETAAMRNGGRVLSFRDLMD